MFSSHILIVDDNEYNRKILTRRLEKRGYQISAVETGEEALKLLEKQSIDLVLLDVMMPGIDGFEVLRQIRKEHSVIELPVIMATSLNAAEDIVHGMQMGANDYVTKPIDLAVAEVRIQTHLQVKHLTEERNRILEIVSHDIKKPLIIITDILDTLVTDYADFISTKPEVREMIDMVHDTSTDLNTLVEDFLDMRVMENGTIVLQKRAEDLNEIVKDVSNRFKHLARKKNISLKLRVAESIPKVECDRARITQVVENMLGNAIKFSPNDTEITLSTSVEKDSLVVSVSDQGPGIPAEEIDKVFMRFTRISNRPDADESSTGLGMSLCKNLVVLHDGEIGVRNNEQKGAKFWFSLPV